MERVKWLRQVHRPRFSQIQAVEHAGSERRHFDKTIIVQPTCAGRGRRIATAMTIAEIGLGVEMPRPGLFLR
jgi:hypothetical protein